MRRQQTTKSVRLRHIYLMGACPLILIEPTHQSNITGLLKKRNQTTQAYFIATHGLQLSLLSLSPPLFFFYQHLCLSRNHLCACFNSWGNHNRIYTTVIVFQLENEGTNIHVIVSCRIRFGILAHDHVLSPCMCTLKGLVYFHLDRRIYLHALVAKTPNMIRYAGPQKVMYANK